MVVAVSLVEARGLDDEVVEVERVGVGERASVARRHRIGERLEAALRPRDAVEHVADAGRVGGAAERAEAAPHDDAGFGTIDDAETPTAGAKSQERPGVEGERGDAIASGEAQQAAAELRRGLAREGEHEHSVRRRALGEEARDAVHERLRLAAPGAGHDEQRTGRRRGLVLHLVEVFSRAHMTTLPNPHP